MDSYNCDLSRRLKLKSWLPYLAKRMPAALIQHTLPSESCWDQFFNHKYSQFLNLPSQVQYKWIMVVNDSLLPLALMSFHEKKTHFPIIFLVSRIIHRSQIAYQSSGCISSFPNIAKSSIKDNKNLSFKLWQSELLTWWVLRSLLTLRVVNLTHDMWYRAMV